MALVSAKLVEITKLVSGITAPQAAVSGRKDTAVAIESLSKPIRTIAGYQREAAFRIEVSTRGARDDVALWDEVERVIGLLETAQGYKPGDTIAVAEGNQANDRIVAINAIFLLGPD